MSWTPNSAGLDGWKRVSIRFLHWMLAAAALLLATACTEDTEDASPDAAPETAVHSLRWNPSSSRSGTTATTTPDTTVPAPAPQPEAAENLCEFSVYGTHHTNIRDRVTSNGGEIGSGGGMEVGVNSRINGKVASAGDVFLRNYALVNGDVTTGGQVNYQYGARVNGTVTEHTPPPPFSIPTKTVTPGTRDIFLYQGQSRVLSPGAYDEIHAYGGSTLTLTAGVYNVRLFIIESSSVTLRINITNGPVEVNVQGQLRFGDRMNMSLVGGTDPNDARFYTNYTSKVSIGTDLTFYGLVTAPNGEIYAYSRTRLNGSLYAKRVTVDTDSQITSPGCPACLTGACCDNWHFRPAGYECRASSGFCDQAEACTGTSGDCPPDEAAPSTQVCRAQDGICDVEETCDGVNKTCPENSYAPSTQECRAAAAGCDVPENCTGNGPTCPADGFADAQTVCRESAGDCDVPEQCTGTSPECPQDAFAPTTLECRPAEDVCDVSEHCTGAAPTCPADAAAPSSTLCRETAGICDLPEMCDGTNKACPSDTFQPTTETCRAAAGVCDVAENCTGASADCPQDSLEPSSTTCRSADGICDVAESCTGQSADCPPDNVADSTTLCRGSGGICDVAESCDGASKDCPSDAFLPNTMTCRESAGICDVDETCTGTSSQCPEDLKAPATTICRDAADICDVAENCDGQSVDCPANEFQMPGYSCSNENACDGPEACDGTGTCVPGQPPILDDNNPCTVDSCDPEEGVLHTPVTDGTSCSDGNICNGDETCQSGACTPGSEPNLDDGNMCTDDICTPEDGIQHVPIDAEIECDEGNICEGIPTSVCREGQCVPDTELIPFGSGNLPYQIYPYGGSPSAYWQFSFEDSDYTIGAAPFGSGGGCPIQARRQTTWPVSTELIIRKWLTFEGDEGDLTIDVAIDNDIAIYFNEINITGGIRSHEGCADYNRLVYTIPQNLITIGDNLLAVRALDRGGEAALDLHLSAALNGPPVIDDGNPCTDDSCDPVEGVSHTPVPDGTSCSDDNVCNGDETCLSGECTLGEEQNIDDGNPCTLDSCDPATGPIHDTMPDGSECDDESIEYGLYEDLDTFVGATSAERVVDFPTPGSYGASYVENGVVIEQLDGMNLFVTNDRSTQTPGYEFIVSGQESINISLPEPVASLGMFLEDSMSDPSSPDVCPKSDSSFWLTFKSGGAEGTIVTSLEVNPPVDETYFWGVVTRFPFDYIEIGEIGAAPGENNGPHCENDYFGDMYIGAPITCPVGQECPPSVCIAAECVPVMNLCEDVDVDDENPCTEDSCDPAVGVLHTPVEDGISCADNDVCNGAETCQAGVCEDGEPPGVDDGNLCTEDLCDPVLGVIHLPATPGTVCSCTTPECNSGVTVPAGFQVRKVADITTPMSLAVPPSTSEFPAGLYVGQGSSTGEICSVQRVSDSGEVVSFAVTGRGSIPSLEFGPDGTPYAGRLIASANHGHGVETAGAVQSIGPAGEVIDLTPPIGQPGAPSEHMGLVIPRDFAYGTGILLANDWYTPGDILRVDDQGLTTFLTDGQFNWGLGPSDVEFGPGGDWGDELFFSDKRDSVNWLKVAHADGTYSGFGVDPLEAAPRTIAFGPGGLWGTDLYAAPIGGEVFRVAPDGSSTTFAEGFISIGAGGDALLFSRDGSVLYVADFAGNAVYAIQPADRCDDVAQCVRTNQPPVADAGGHQEVPRSEPVTLFGSVEDDGLPMDGVLTVDWSVVSGPGEVDLSDPSSAVTEATFSAAGEYLLRLTASDGELESFDEVMITVNPLPNQPPEIISEPITEAYVEEATNISPFDFTSWQVVSFPYHETESPVWVVADDNLTVEQIINAWPSIFLSDFVMTNDIIRGTWRTEDSGNDDDFMGFVFGYQDPEHFYLFDWKRADQTVDNVGFGAQGMSIKVVNSDEEVSGVEFWSTDGSPGAIETIFHNDISYQLYQDYHFTLEFHPDVFTITIEDDASILAEISIERDAYPSGLFGFYNNSQANVIYQGFTREDLSQGTYNYDVDAVDPDNDIILYDLIEFPDGMVIDPVTGAISWTPTIDDLGTHTVHVRADDGRGLWDDQIYDLTVSVLNTPPVVDAGPDLEITLPDTATLEGSVTDDGLPEDGTLTVEWSVVSGPGDVIFSDPNSAVTEATFSAAGEYVLRLTASDGELESSDEVVIVVNPPPNQPPEIVSEPVTEFVLNAERGEETEVLLENWEVVQLSDFGYGDGPGSWTISDGGTMATQVNNADPSGLISDFYLDGGEISGEFGIMTDGDDDYIGFVFGYQDASHFYIFDWKMAYQEAQTGEPMYAGMRLRVMNSEQALTYADFTNNEALLTNDVPWERYIWYRFELAYHPGLISITVTDPSDNVLADFTVEDWTYTSGRFGFFNQSQEQAAYRGFYSASLPALEYVYDVDAIDPDDDNITYSVVAGPDRLEIDPDSGIVRWTPTDEDVGVHPVHLQATDEWGLYDEQIYDLTVLQMNTPPEVDAGPDLEITLPETATLEGSVTDDGLPEDETLTVEWSVVSGPGEVDFSNPTSAVTDATFSDAGEYLLRLTANDGDLEDFDEVAITVDVEVPIAHDDAYNVEPRIVGLPDGFNARFLAKPNKFYELSGIAFDGDRTLYVVDLMTRNGDDLIYELDVPTRALRILQSGPPTFYPRQGLVADGRSPLGTDLIVADWNSDGESTCCTGYEGRIFAIDRVSGAVRVVSAGTAEYPFRNPYDMDLAPESFGGGLFIVDASINYRAPALYQLDTDGVTSVFFLDPAVWPSSRNPHSIAFGNGGGYGDDLFVSDNGDVSPIIWKITSDKTVTQFATTGIDGAGAIAFSRGGVFGQALYLMDFYSERVSVVAEDGTVSIFASELPWPNDERRHSDLAFSTDGTSLFVGTPISVLEIYAADSPIVEAPGPLGNDESLSGHPLSATLLSPPQHGQVALDLDGAFVYTPPVGFVGTDNFTYVANDGIHDSNVATVTLVVGFSNEPPGVWAGPDLTVSEAELVVLDGRVGDDGFPEGSSLSQTWSVVSGPGNVTFSDPNSAETEAVFYEEGEYVLQLEATDGELVASDAVIVVVETVCIEPPAGMVAWWPGDGTDEDIVGGIGASSILGAISYETGTVDEGIKFNGTSGLVFDDDPIFHFESDDSFSFDMWARVDGMGAGSNRDDAIIDKRATDPDTGVGQRGFLLDVLHPSDAPNGSIQFQLTIAENNGDVDKVAYSKSQIVQVGVWYFVAAVVDRQDDTMLIYINGELHSEVDISGVGDISNSGRLYIGHHSEDLYTNVRPFNGVVDELEVFRRALTQAEIEDLYNAGSAGKCKSAPPTNTPPVVEAGPDQLVELPNDIALNGIVTDDGLPDGTLASSWTQLDGPNSVVFDDSSAPQTTAATTTPGNYYLELSATDGELSSSDDMQACVAEPNERVVDDFEIDGDLSKWRRIYTGADAGPIGVSDGVFWTGAGYGDTTGPTEHKMFGTYKRYSPFGGGVVARARIRLGGDYQIFGFGEEGAHLGGSNLRIGFTTLRRDEDNAKPHTVYARAAAMDSNGDWHGFFYQEISASWYDVFHEFQIEWQQNLVRYYVDGALVAETTVPLSCNLELNLGNQRTHLMETEWVEVYQLGMENNAAPIVDAGADFEGVAGMPLTLIGSVVDDGNPTGETLTTTWTHETGPGDADFGDPGAPVTTVTFSEPGIHTLRLTASDGELSARDEITVVVETSEINDPPVVDAGPDQTVTLPDTITVSGVVTDDGLPNGTLTHVWTGPPEAIIADPYSLTTEVAFLAAGNYELVLTADDSELIAFDSLTVEVGDEPTENQPPVVNAGPDLTAFANEGIVIHGSYTDDGLPEGGPVSVLWGLISGPAQPNVVDIEALDLDVLFPVEGTYELILFVNDGELDGYDLVTVEVGPPRNQAPVVNAGPDQGITLPDNSVTLVGSFTDDGLAPGGPVTTLWSQIDGPVLATIVSPEALSTVVTFPEDGTYTFELLADDGDLSGTDYVTIFVNPDPNQAPTVDIIGESFADINVGLALGANVTDDQYPIGGQLTAQWSMVSGPEGGVVTFSDPQSLSTSAQFSVVGNYVLGLTVSDGALPGYDDHPVAVDNGHEPTVALTSPSDGASITAPTDVIGSVQHGDNPLDEWTIDVREVGTDTFRTMATGSNEVTDAVIGTLDPTLLLNGQHELRLSARDTVGRSASVSIFIVVEGNMKVGNFTVSFKDLSVPLAGIPIEIIRTYDSRDKHQGDFGVGWTLDIRSVKTQESRPIATEWYTTVTSDWVVDEYCIHPWSPHLVTVTLSDGKVFKFEARPAMECQLGAPISETQVVFEPLYGTNASLVARGDTTVQIEGSWPGEVDLYQLGEASLFDPDNYQLILQDGRVLELSQVAGLEGMRDLNGNELTVTDDGIFHSSGRSIAFERDGNGRIIGITDPMGEVLAYGYDDAGDLETFTDREDSTTSFGYNDRHDLLTIEDPRGIQPIRNEYDSSGRLTRHVDADGNEINYTHDIAGRQEIVEDRLGNVTVHIYDDRGNVLQTTNPVGDVTTYTYDDRDNQLTECNHYDECSTYTYDDDDNRITEEDPLGNTTTYEYDERGNVLTITDPLGRVTENEYDETTGNLTSTIDAMDNITEYEYNAQGLQTLMRDALGNETLYAYDSVGNLTQETDPAGKVTTYGYDSNGNRVRETTSRTTPDGVVTVETLFTYDAEGRLIETTHPDGSVTSTEYNDIGQQAATIDPLGRRTELTYDDLGRVVTTTYPDSTTETTTYDAEGRRIASQDRAGRVTQYEYDAAGRLTRTIFPDNTDTETVYDQAGRTIRTIDEAGYATEFTYDAAGRRTDVTDALGNVTHSEYNEVGNQISMTDPLGSTTTYEYDDLNRQVRVIHPDGTVDETEYDELGRRVAKIDQAGVRTEYGYDAAGRLIQVLDAEGGLTQYGYDELGNQVSQIDALGRETTFEYDNKGRRTVRTLPMGDFETMAYNPAGNLVAKTDFMGRTITYEYDLNNRLERKIFPDTTEKTFTYSPTGQRLTATDDRGTTTYTYDIRGRITEHQYPDGRTLAYTYDNRGNRTAISATASGVTLTTTYTHDPLGRLATVTDPNNDVYTYNYDANGRRTGLTQPNGTETTYQYDNLNRLTDLETVHTPTSNVIQSYQYTLGNTGIRTRIDENDGAARIFGYDNLYRLTDETLAGTTGYDYTKQFVYDAVGNRLTQTTTGYNADTVTYAYDDRDRLQTENSTAYDWDENGNLTAKSGEADYEWDFEDRLIGVDMADGTSVIHMYDVDGVRVQSLVNDGVDTEEKNYLVDTAGALSHVVLETDGSGNLVAYYVRGGDQLLAVLSGGEARYYHSEGIGSVRVLSDGEGNVTDEYGYTAFGEELGWSGGSLQPYRFVGEEWRGPLYHLRARYLLPEIGSFLSIDPLVALPEMGTESYAYAQNRPSQLVDPSGLLAAAVLGTFIHRDIRAQYPRPTDLLPNAAIPGFPIALLPDLADRRTKEVMEIKPASRYGLGGWHQLQGYILTLNFVGLHGGGWHSGSWSPSPGVHTLLSNPRISYVVLGNFQGIIFYRLFRSQPAKRVLERINDRISDLSGSVGLSALSAQVDVELARNIGVMGGKAIGVFALASVGRYLLLSSMPSAQLICR